MKFPITMKPQEQEICLRSIDRVCRKFPGGIFVEVGTMYGYSSVPFLKRIEKNAQAATYIGVDKDPEVFAEWSKRVEALSLKRTTAYLLSKDSREAFEGFRDEIAWLLVDACHCYECALWDIDNWGSRVVVGGGLVIHDTHMNHTRATVKNQHGGTRPFGVRRAVEDSLIRKVRFCLWEEYEPHNGVMSFIRVE